ncbi:MAG: GNAT family N-acetyltransferase [Candidatus Thiodiazotropha sp.]
MNTPATAHGDSQEPLAGLALRLRNEARLRNHRHMICLSGTESWCIESADQIVLAVGDANTLWIGTRGDLPCPTLDNSRALTRLGSDTGILVYNAHSGFDPDAFGALSGTLQGGGLLLLLTPPLTQWANFPDPQRARIAVANYDLSSHPSRFLARLGRLLEQDPRVTLATPEGLRPGSMAPRVNPDPIPDDELCRTPDQARAVEAIRHTARGHRHRPLVLTADRGRGKSSALGIAAAQLMTDGYPGIEVTAPSRQCVSSLFEQVERYQQRPQSAESTPALQQALSFVAPDELLKRPRQADLLLVDEAAAIPTPILQALLNRYPRIVFATTVHGYEGTGMGFNHRFKKHLDQVRPQWRELVLREPIRWHRDDPLEQTVFRLLALDAEPADINNQHRLDDQRLQYAFPDPQSFVDSEEDLRQLFGLLILAHYRTTPLDLRQLLDGPNLQIMLLREEQRILGVALLAAEGGFTQHLSEQIWSGVRRPRGHLLAQSLTAHLGLAHAATLRGLRIMRIAVHPAVQGRGLGRRMLKVIETRARELAFDYLGVSCGATPGLIRFWQHNQLLPVRLGVRSGASSSVPSAMFLRGLNVAGDSLLEDARDRFAQQLPPLLREPLADLPADWLAPLLIGGPFPATNTLNHQDWLDLIAFGFGQRGYEISQAPIERLTLWGLAEQQVVGDDARLLIMRVLQGHSWKHCANGCGLPGRKGVEMRLRYILRPLIEAQCIASARKALNGLKERKDGS